MKTEVLGRQYFKIYKPYGMLSQFTQEVKGQQTLLDLEYEFGKDVYPIGRLDRDSEGLLLLSNDKSLNQKLLQPRQKVSKVYLAQVEGVPSPSALLQVSKGVVIKVKGKIHQCAPCRAELLTEKPNLPDRYPPIRYRKSIPTSWVRVTLTEGKNRQVRKMMAKVGFPVLRLVRIEMDKVSLEDMKPGEVRMIKW